MSLTMGDSRDGYMVSASHPACKPAGQDINLQRSEETWLNLGGTWSWDYMGTRLDNKENSSDASSSTRQVPALPFRTADYSDHQNDNRGDQRLCRIHKNYCTRCSMHCACAYSFYIAVHIIGLNNRSWIDATKSFKNGFIIAHPP